MRTTSLRIALFALFLLIGSVLAPLAADPLEATGTPPGAAADATPPLARHAAEAHALGAALQAVIGPLPAIASTPFFALAGLTGLALLSQSESPSVPTLTALLRRNALIREASRYASPKLLAALLALAVLGWLANSGKIQGAAGKVIRMAEDSSSVLAYLYLCLATLAAEAPGVAPAVATAGVLDISMRTLLALAIAAGLAALMVARFALDVLIWLSPVPMLDLLFETAKWGFTAGFALIAVFFPRLAAGLSLVLVIVALLVSRWAFRLVRFTFRMVLAPCFDAWLGRPAPALEDPFTITAAALRAPGLPARSLGRVQGAPGGLRFCSLRWSGREREHALGGEGTVLELGRTLLWIELRVLGPDGRIRERYAIARSWLPAFAALCARLGARDGGAYGLASLGRTTPRPAVPAVTA